MERSDIQLAIGEIAKRHNILLSPDDPLLVLVTLNEVILRRLLDKQTAAISASQDQIAAGTAQQLHAAKDIAAAIITRAAQFLDEGLREATEAHKRELLAAAAAGKEGLASYVTAARAASRSAWYGAVTVIAVACTALGITIGMLIELPSPKTEGRPHPGIAAWR